MKKITMFVLFFSLTSSLWAKPHMVAEVGDISCLSSNKGNDDIISRIGVTLEGDKSEDRELVVRILNTLVEMTNEQQAERLLSGLTIRIKDVLGKTSIGSCMPAHQLVRNEIHLGRFCPTKANKLVEISGRKIIMVHEIAHFIANKRGFYPKYNSEVRKTCKLTNYMTKMSNGKQLKNRNEEFAEVFAAYLTYGKNLKRSCKKSYEFMKEHLFLGSESQCN